MLPLLWLEPEPDEPELVPCEPESGLGEECQREPHQPRCWLGASAGRACCGVPVDGRGAEGALLSRELGEVASRSSSGAPTPKGATGARGAAVGEVWSSTVPAMDPAAAGLIPLTPGRLAPPASPGMTCSRSGEVGRAGGTA